MKLFVAIVLCLTGESCLSQVEMKGIWENQNNPLNSFKMYDKTGSCYDIFRFRTGKIVVDRLIFGFYENCDPPHIDSLTRMGTGRYFFEIDDLSIESEKEGILSPNKLDCWSVEIDHYKNMADYVPDSLYLHFGRRAIMEYKKVPFLPPAIVNYLEKEKPDIYSEYLKLVEE